MLKPGHLEAKTLLSQRREVGRSARARGIPRKFLQLNGLVPTLVPADRHRLLFDINIAGTFRANLDCEIIDCNLALARILGYGSREEVLASGVPCPLPPDLEAVLANLRQAGTLRRFKVRGRRKDGSVFWALENLALAMSDGGATPELEGTLIEIGGQAFAGTGESNAGRDAHLGLLARGVIHDVNNLLTAVLGGCETLADELGKDDRVQTLVDGVKRAGEWAASLTSELLAKNPCRGEGLQIFDLNDFLAGMAPVLRRILGENVIVSSTFEARSAGILANPSQLGQVVLNLAVNAREAMPGGGKLDISTSNASAGCGRALGADRQACDYVLLAVTDAGQGMDAATQARIFEPFFTTKARGKGIGLATVKDIIQKAGGFIEVASRPGAGTTFSIYIPQAAGPSRAIAVTAEPAYRCARVLVVEDEPLLREMARKTLESDGHVVLVAANAPEALRLAQDKSEPIDLMLSDIELPDTGGRELAARLKLLQPDMKVLFMSGYSEADVRGTQVGPQTGFLQKPFKPRTLVSKVQDMLALHSGGNRTEVPGAGVRRARLAKRNPKKARSEMTRSVGRPAQREPGRDHGSIARLPATLPAST